MTELSGEGTFLNPKKFNLKKATARNSRVPRDPMPGKSFEGLTVGPMIDMEHTTVGLQKPKALGPFSK